MHALHAGEQKATKLQRGVRTYVNNRRVYRVVFGLWSCFCVSLLHVEVNRRATSLLLAQNIALKWYQKEETLL